MKVNHFVISNNSNKGCNF